MSGGSWDGDQLWADSAGDGGVAGSGGIITVSETAIIYAYNGDRITDGDYTTIYYEYEADGTITSIESSVLTKNDEYSTNIIPTTIYAQDGILREVYKFNAWWDTKTNYNYSYFFSLFGDTIADGVEDITIATSKSDSSNYLVREETTCSTTGYVNPATGSNQGIGSGAGYIELSNGTYTVDSSMN